MIKLEKLYIITGPAGVGKSTISKEIAKHKKKSVLLEGDDIYHQVVGGYINAWTDGNHLEIFWKVCLNTIKIYLENGYDVIFNYIINPENVEMLKNEFKKYDIKFIILISNEKILLKRDNLRPEDCQMKERCIKLLESFKNKNFAEKFYLDTTHLSVEETVVKIENCTQFIV